MEKFLSRAMALTACAAAVGPLVAFLRTVFGRAVEVGGAVDQFVISVFPASIIGLGEASGGVRLLFISLASNFIVFAMLVGMFYFIRHMAGFFIATLLMMVIVCFWHLWAAGLPVGGAEWGALSLSMLMYGFVFFLAATINSPE